MLKEQPDRKIFFAKILLFVLFIAITYGIGGWITTLLVGVLLIVPPTLINLVWKLKWFKTLENNSPGVSHTIKLVTYGVLIILLILIVVSMVILTYSVALPTAD